MIENYFVVEPLKMSKSPDMTWIGSRVLFQFEDFIFLFGAEIQNTESGIQNLNSSGKEKKKIENS